MESHGQVDVRVPRKPFFLGLIRSITTDMACRLEIPETAIYKIEMAVSEAATNIVEHSNHNGPISIIYSFSPDRFHIKIQAQGEPYYEDFSRRNDEFLEKQIQAQCERGYGIAIIKKLMDEVHYRHLEQEGNELELIKYR